MHAYFSLSPKSTPTCIGRGQQKTLRVLDCRFRGFPQTGMQLRPSLQHSSRSNSIPICRASGGVLGGLKKIFQGKTKPKRSADVVEFPPCRYVVFLTVLHQLFLPATVLGSPSLTCQSNMCSFQHCMFIETALAVRADS